MRGQAVYCCLLASGEDPRPSLNILLRQYLFLSVNHVKDSESVLLGCASRKECIAPLETLIITNAPRPCQSDLTL